MEKQIQLVGPVFALSHREAVEVEPGDHLPRAMDPEFLLTSAYVDDDGRTTDERGVLLFSRPEFASRFLATLDKPLCAITTFRGTADLLSCLATCRDRQVRWAIFDKESENGGATYLTIDEFIAANGG